MKRLGVAMGVVAVLAIYALVIAVGQKSPSATFAAGAQNDRPSQVAPRDVLALLLPGPYPVRGVILGRRGLGGYGEWTIVDFDRPTIERFFVRMSADGKPVADEYSRVGRSLSVDEVNAIVDGANAVRKPPAGRDPPDTPPTDRSCDVVLLDGRDDLFSFGAACPAGSDHLIETIGGLASRTPSR